MGDFKISLSPMDSSFKQKPHREMLEVTDTILLCNRIIPHCVNCYVALFLGIHFPDKTPMTEKNTDIIKVQFGELMNCIGIIYRNMVEELLTRAEMTQRQMNNKSSHQYV